MKAIIRKAVREDLVSIIELLADDQLGAKRELARGQMDPDYVTAFEAIDADDRNELVVMESEGLVIGTLQLTFLPYLTYTGGLRAQIEAVRISNSYRGQGLGKELILWALARSKEKGAHMVQLTTDKQRPSAVRFYESLGFRASHEGMKLKLD